MLKTLWIIAVLSALPVPFMLLLRAIDRKATFATGYVSGLILNLTVFGMCVTSMAEQMEAPGLKPVKAVLVLCILEAVCFLAVLLIRCIRAKKWIGVISKQPKDKIHKQNVIIIVVAVLVWIIGAVSYFRYVPNNAVAMMADVNRIDFFGVTNGDPMVMLGYYLKNLTGISQANAICLAVPLCFYPAFVTVMWEVANSLFVKNVSSEQAEKGAHKRALCFLAEAILVVLGDCLYTVPYMVLHGLNQIGDIVLVLALPLTFAIGVSLYFVQDELWNKETKKLKGIGNVIALGLCLICTWLLDARAFALVSLSTVIFILLFIGRRYLPWLKSSKS